MQTYQNHKTWKDMQKYLPENNRINSEVYPDEYYWEWQDNKIHIDFYKNDSSKAKLILLHGVGGNGRLLSFIGVPLFKRGYEVICPDLPGYGITQMGNNIIDYNIWVNMVKGLIEIESKKDNKEIILFGLSAGGMLAYHAGCDNDKISGMIFTNLLDQRLQEVRDSSALNKVVSRLGIYFIYLLNYINSEIKLPMKLVANMKEIVNNEEVLNLLIKDDKSSGAKVPVKFITSMLNYKPEIELENYKGCPVLLVHPENDRWTDVRLSKLSFDKLKCEKEIKILEGAGHFPIEKSGLTQLEEYLVAFIQKIIIRLT